MGVCQKHFNLRQNELLFGLVSVDNILIIKVHLLVANLHSKLRPDFKLNHIWVAPEEFACRAYCISCSQAGIGVLGILPRMLLERPVEAARELMQIRVDGCCVSKTIELLTDVRFIDREAPRRLPGQLVDH